jgi:hypothetical protein
LVVGGDHNYLVNYANLGQKYILVLLKNSLRSVTWWEVWSTTLQCMYSQNVGCDLLLLRLTRDLAVLQMSLI